MSARHVVGTIALLTALACSTVYAGALYSGQVDSAQGKIIFVSARDGPEELYLMETDGSNVQRLTRSPSGNSFQPAPSPDGRRIAFVSDRDGNSEIYVLGNSLHRLLITIRGFFVGDRL